MPAQLNLRGMIGEGHFAIVVRMLFGIELFWNTARAQSLEGGVCQDYIALSTARYAC